MLAKTLDEAWRARSAEQPIEVSPTFCGDGLMLGAGTLLAGIERETGVFGCDDARLLTLLSVGYGRPIASDALRHIRRGVRCWREGDSALASMHLAHARLGKLPAPRDAARRLFLADRLMQAGAEPEVILRAAGLAAPEPGDGLFRQFAVDQPRVPAGSPDGGQWVAEFGSAIARLSEKALLGMARVAARASAPATFLTVLFTPTPTGGKGHVIKVPGHPGLTLSRGGDEALWRLTDEDAGTTTFLRDTNGVLTDPKGKVVGRLLTTGVLALDLAAVATERFKDEPTVHRDDQYPHEFLDQAPYDGILVSRGIVGDARHTGKYSEAQLMRFRREGARRFLRYPLERFPGSMLMGDCGAFTYRNLPEPPFGAEDTVEFYADGGFTHGCSPDHLIFDFDDEGTDRALADVPDDVRRRYEITLQYAEDFLGELQATRSVLHATGRRTGLVGPEHGNGRREPGEDGLRLGRQNAEELAAAARHRHHRPRLCDGRRRFSLADREYRHHDAVGPNDDADGRQLRRVRTRHDPRAHERRLG